MSRLRFSSDDLFITGLLGFVIGGILVLALVIATDNTITVNHFEGGIKITDADQNRSFVSTSDDRTCEIFLGLVEARR